MDEGVRRCCDQPFVRCDGPNGTLTIKNVPPGTSNIEDWTATSGTQEKTVTVHWHQAATVDFTFRHE